MIEPVKFRLPDHLIATHQLDADQDLVTCTRCGETARIARWDGGVSAQKFFDEHVHCSGPVDMSWVNLVEIGHA
jgi:hypothetical protein